MNDERDPMLESLFEQASHELVDRSFTAQVMSGIEKHRRNMLVGRLSVVVLLIAFELLLNAPLQNSVGVLTNTLSAALIDLDNEWLAYAVGPLNSLAGLIGILLIGMQFLFRKVLR